MFQIQPFLTCIGVSPYFKESAVKTIVNSMLFIDFISASGVDPRVFYVYNVNKLKNVSPIFHLLPCSNRIRQLYVKYFKVKSLEDMGKISLKNWNEEKLILLIWMVSSYESLMNRESIDFTEFDWQTLANLFPNISSQFLQFKWLLLFQRTEKSSYDWTEPEDALLLEIVRQFPKSKALKWSEVAQKLCIRADNPLRIKTGKECRERFINHLDPGLKRNHWSLSEDILLLEFTLSVSRKWAKLSKYFPGRTQHNIKNRFISLMVKHLKVSRKDLAEMMKSKSLEPEILCCIASVKSKNKKGVHSCRNQKKEKLRDHPKIQCELSPQQLASNFHEEGLDFFKY